jgi:pyruvate kinase
LRREMRGEEGDGVKSDGKGKGKEGESSPPSAPSEQAMFAQLDKMRDVIRGLEERLLVAEENGWNLLICAIGAELEAFRQAEGMLREALRASGFDLDEDEPDQTESTPRMGRSTSLMNSAHRMDEAEPSGGGKLVDLHEGPDEDREPESDNEVPRDLLVAAEEEHEPASPALSRESSNEVPAEFLREHSDDGEYPGFGAMA